MTNGLLVFMTKYLRISSYIRKPCYCSLLQFPIYEENFIYFLSVYIFVHWPIPLLLQEGPDVHLLVHVVPGLASHPHHRHPSLHRPLLHEHADLHRHQEESAGQHPFSLRHAIDIFLGITNRVLRLEFRIFPHPNTWQSRPCALLQGT
jgi:hypothetical protein